MSIEDTSQRDPMLHLLGSLGDPSGYITGMEAAGQRQLLASEMLPAQGPWERVTGQSYKDDKGTMALGLRHYLRRLRTEGEILTQWVEQPFLWLLTYRDDDVEGYDYKAINAERLARLPGHVRRAVLA